MMIGGGGDYCKRADHGIVITEEASARFNGYPGNCDRDFGDDCNYSNSYSLNLWIKQLDRYARICKNQNGIVVQRQH